MAVPAAAPKIASANTCGPTSPLLASKGAQFTYDGNADAGFVSITMWGKFTLSNPSADCVYVRTEITTEVGLDMYNPDRFAQNFWHDTGTAWVYNSTDSGTTGCTQSGCTSQFIDSVMLNGNPGTGTDCWLTNDEVVSGHGLSTYFYDASSGHGPFQYSTTNGYIPSMYTSVCPGP